MRTPAQTGYLPGDCRPHHRPHASFDVLDMACKAIGQGAAGVDMGRNVSGAEDPVAMIRAAGSTRVRVQAFLSRMI